MHIRLYKTLQNKSKSTTKSLSIPRPRTAPAFCRIPSHIATHDEVASAECKEHTEGFGLPHALNRLLGAVWMESLEKSVTAEICEPVAELSEPRLLAGKGMSQPLCISSRSVGLSCVSRVYTLVPGETLSLEAWRSWAHGSVFGTQIRSLKAGGVGGLCCFCCCCCWGFGVQQREGPSIKVRNLLWLCWTTLLGRAPRAT